MLKKDNNFVNVKYDANGVVQYEEFEDKSVTELVELLSEDVKNPFEAQVSTDKTLNAVPVIEEKLSNTPPNPKVASDTESIINNLNAILEENKNNNAIDNNQDVKNFEEVKLIFLLINLQKTVLSLMNNNTKRCFFFV